MGHARDSLHRKLVLVDLENLLFGEHEEEDLPILNTRSRQIRDLAQARRDEDQLVIGCNPHLAFAARSAFPRAKIVVGSGPDGADNALLRSFDLSVAQRRFHEVCIVSGDHAFADLAQQVRLGGLGVRIVAPKFGLSDQLRLQATKTILLSTPDRDTWPAQNTEPRAA